MSVEITTTENKLGAGRNPITTELLKERRAYVGLLKMKGFSILDIMNQVNSKNSEKHWGTIGKYTVSNDLKHYYAREKRLSTKDLREEEQALFKSQLDFYETQRSTIMQKLFNNTLLKAKIAQAETSEDKKLLGKPMSDMGETMNYETVLKYSDKIDELRGWKKGTSVNVLFNNSFNDSNNFYEGAREGTIKGESKNAASRLAGLIRQSFSDNRETQSEDGLVESS